MLAKLAKLFDGLSEPGDKAVDENQLTRLAATALMTWRRYSFDQEHGSKAARH